MRIAHFGPLPPLRTGISDYCASLLPRLASLADVDLWVDQDEISLPWLDKFRVVNYLENPDSISDLKHYDTLLYHMGNNPDFHSNLFEVLLEHPGVVILHDYVLHHFMAMYYLEQKRSKTTYKEEMQRNYGERGARIANAMFDAAGNYNWQGPALWTTQVEQYPMNERVIESATGIVVHSETIRQRLCSGTTPPVRKIPFLNQTVSLSRDTVKERTRPGLDSRRFTIGTFGTYGPHKRVPQILSAVSMLRTEIPTAQVLLVGWGYPESDIRQEAERVGLDRDAVQIVTTAKTDEQFESYMLAADVCTFLRFPTMGETSGTVLRAMALQRPVLVSNVGWYSELPDRCVLKVDPDELEMDLLAECIHELYKNPGLAAALGRSARTFVLQNHDPVKVAQEYLNFLSEICSPVKSLQGRLASVLGDAMVTLWDKTSDALVKRAAGVVAELTSTR